MNTDIDALARRLGDRLRAMEAENDPPYDVDDAEPFDLRRGDIQLLIKSLRLLEAVRFATK